MAQKLDIVLRNSLDFNIKFVKSVEKYPRLYVDQPLSRVMTQNDWKKVAEILDYEVSHHHLKLHWQKLRIKYVQFVKNGTQDDPDRIESYMHFLKPHLRVEAMQKRRDKYRRIREPLPDSDSPTVPKIARVESYAHLGLDPGDKDVAFLLSILPHMKVMNGPQRRQFKIGAVMLSEEILRRI